MNRRVYMYTLSRRKRDGGESADAGTGPEAFTRQSFADVVLNAYAEANGIQVEHWACVRELHKDGLPHFHMVVKGKECFRFRRVTKILHDKGIRVYASFGAPGYATYFRYLVLPSAKKSKSELDAAILLSPHHPSKREAATLPPNQGALNERVKPQKDGKEEEKGKAERMSGRVAAIHTINELDLLGLHSLATDFLAFSSFLFRLAFNA